MFLGFSVEVDLSFIDFVNSDYEIGYGYDSYGRFSSVSSSVQSVQSVVAYSYLNNSDLISGYTVDSGLSVTKSYEANRNLITSIDSKFDNTTISQYDYINDAGGRRTAVKSSGSAFLNPSFNQYGYNTRSELTAIQTHEIEKRKSGK